MTHTTANPENFTHIFATILPPSVEDLPICGAVLSRDWSARGKPECPACNAERARLRAAAAAKRVAGRPRPERPIVRNGVTYYPTHRPDGRVVYVTIPEE